MDVKPGPKWGRFERQHAVKGAPQPAPSSCRARQESKIPSAWAAVLHGSAFNRLMQAVEATFTRSNIF